MTQLSARVFTVTGRTDTNGPVALVCLVGEIDIAAAEALSDVADHLSTLAPHAEVVVDLAEVSFACSTLPNFLDRVHRTLAADATLTLCRSTPNTRWVLQATGIEQIAALRADLPDSCEAPQPASGKRFLPSTRPRNSNRR